MTSTKAQERGERVNDRCLHHSALCAYDASDPARCPFCHAPYAVIERTDWHGCEKPRAWHSGSKPKHLATAKAAEAVRLRAEAAYKRGHGMLPAPMTHLPLNAYRDSGRAPVRRDSNTDTTEAA